MEGYPKKQTLLPPQLMRESVPAEERTRSLLRQYDRGRWLPRAGFILSLLVLVGCYEKTAENPESLRETATNDVADNGGVLMLTTEQLAAGDMTLGTPSVRTFPKRIRTAGMVDVPPEYKAAVGAYFPGFVRDLKLIVGDYVRRGQTLLRVENPDLIPLQQSLLELRVDTARLRTEAERLEQLATENIAAEKDAVAARSALDRSLAQLAGLSRKLRMIGVDPAEVRADKFVDNIVVRAPVSGHVTEVYATTGQFISPGNPALELINTDHIHLELEAFEKDVVYLEEGQDIEYWLPSQPGEKGLAEIHRIGKTIEEAQRTVHVHADPKPGELTNILLPGMFVEAEILVASDAQLAVPEEAVVFLEQNAYVLVVSREYRGQLYFRQESVTVGQTQNGWIEILPTMGLSTDDRILTKGAHRLVGEGAANAH